MVVITPLWLITWTTQFLLPWCSKLSPITPVLAILSINSYSILLEDLILHHILWWTVNNKTHPSHSSLKPTCWPICFWAQLLNSNNSKLLSRIIMEEEVEALGRHHIKLKVCRCFNNLSPIHYWAFWASSPDWPGHLWWTITSTISSRCNLTRFSLFSMSWTNTRASLLWIRSLSSCNSRPL